MRRLDALSRAAVPLVLACGLVVAVTVLASLGPTLVDRAVITALITLILVVGLYVFVGNSGVFSFGHMSFVTVGAYATAILTISSGQKQFQLPDLPGFLASTSMNPLLATLISGGLAALLALLLAVPITRLSGLTASLATFAVLITVRVVFQNWNQITRGSRGLILDAEAPGRVGILVWALLAMVAAFLFQRSALGLRLRASREDELAAKSVGIRVSYERGVAFVLSAFISGIGGSLFALHFASISPDTFYVSLTFVVVTMLVVGGLTSLAGAVVGTIVISAVAETLREIEAGFTLGPITMPARFGLTEVGLALVLLLILLLRPDGVTKGKELAWPARLVPPTKAGSASAPGRATPDAVAPDAVARAAGPRVAEEETTVEREGELDHEPEAR